MSDDIIETGKVYQCNLCAHAVGSQLELLKDHLKTPEHLVKKAASARNEKQVGKAVNKRDNLSLRLHIQHVW